MAIFNGYVRSTEATPRHKKGGFHSHGGTRKWMAKMNDHCVTPSLGNRVQTYEITMWLGEQV